MQKKYLKFLFLCPRMDEYEIEDSLKFTPSCYSKEEEGTFINSQDFFMTQECDKKEEFNCKLEEKGDKKEEKVKHIEFEEIKLKNAEEESEVNLESEENSESEDNSNQNKNENESDESEDNSNQNKNENESDESEDDISDEKSEDESESDISSEEIVSVRRSKKNKSTPIKKTVKRTKIKPRKKKKESENKETKKSNKQKEKLTKTIKDKNKDSSNECSLEKDNKYNLNHNELKIFNFFYNINRPVSSTELALNFKGQIVSTALQGICTTLENKSLLIIKVYSKSKIYMINPNVFDMNKAEEYKIELNNKIKLNEELKKKYSDINTELRSLKSMDTEEELDEKIKIIKNNIEEIESRICLKEEGLLVTKKEVEDYEKKMNKINKVYKERSKVVQEILGMLCENMNIKKKELVEEMELDL